MAAFGAAATDTAWAVLAHVGALDDVVYTQIPAPVRNLTTGQTTAAGTAYPLAALCRNFRREEIDGTVVVAGDFLVRFPKVLVPGTPTTRDTVTKDGIVWSVVSVTEGAGGGWWRLHLRRVRPV